VGKIPTFSNSRAWCGVVTLSVGVGTVIQRPAFPAAPPAALQRGTPVTHEAFPARSLSRLSLDD
jgi:hypothetical protein